MIAHHSVIFQPDSLRMWVSTSNWQLGEYICYDLRKVFALKSLAKDTTIAIPALTIAADTFLRTLDFRNFILFRKNKLALLAGKDVDTAQVVHTNPNYYDAYRIAGDYCYNKGWYEAALHYYLRALEMEIATLDEQESIQGKIELCQKQLKI